MTDKQREVFLLHGWGFDSEVFDELIQYLICDWNAQGSEKQLVRVHMINLPGYADVPYQKIESVDELAQYVHDQIQARSDLKSDKVIIAWSMGGLAAIKLLSLEPTLFSCGILLAATPCFARRPDWHSAMTPSLLNSFIEKYQSKPDKVREKFNYLVSEGEGNQRNWLKILREKNQAEPVNRALKDGLNLLKNVDLRRDWENINVPLLGIFGESDTLVPVQVSIDMQSLNPDFQIKIVQSAGHAVFLTHADFVANEILAFLRHET